MSRLIHSYEAQLRSMQMSNTDVFAYCEGKCCDPFFFSELMTRAFSGQGIRFSLKKIDSIEYSGGKIAVCKAFSEYNQRGMLKFSFNGKSKTCIFFLDKDADCIVDRIIVNDNLIYTQLYDVESYLFCFNNIRRMIAVAADLCIDDIPEYFTDSPTWLENKSKLWREWIFLCIMSGYFRVNCGCGYSRKSVLNGDDLLHETDTKMYEEFFHRLIELIHSKHPSKSDQDIEAVVLQIRLKMEALATGNKLHTLLKGKWIFPLLFSEISSSMNTADGNFSSFDEKLKAASKASINFNESWAEYFIERILIATHKPINLLETAPS